MTFNHGPLYGVPGSAVLKVLYANELCAVNTAQGGDAGIHRRITQPFFTGFCEDDGAGTAVAGCAAFLGAGESTVLAKIIQDRCIGS
jgi:hypothetical protein